MNTTLYQNRPEDTQNWTNLYLEPRDYWIYYVNIGLRHQYGISVAESMKSGEKRMFSQAKYSTTCLSLSFVQNLMTRPKQERIRYSSESLFFLDGGLLLSFS